MATPFAFIPRVVSKHAKPWQGISKFPRSRSPSPEPATGSESEGDEADSGEEDTDAESSSPDKGKDKGKEKAAESAQTKQSALTQDIAALVSLALSDYNIWVDPDLRRKLDACLGDDETSSDGAGFVPINYLLRRAPFRGSLPFVGSHPHEPSEMEVVKALRAHASHVLDVRMRTPSSSSIWYGTGKTSRKRDVGGYEARRKDWSQLRDRPSRGWTRARWDNVTIYVEGIPPSYRTVGGVARFVDTLLSPGTQAPPCSFRVQNVTLPPHYLDKPGDTPKCKGYALVTLSATLHAEALLRAWPWKRRDALVPVDDEDAAAPQTVKEAHKYGVRAISKARWDALNEEYLLHKQSLVDAISTCTDAAHAGAPPPPDALETTADERRRWHDEASRTTMPASSYPFDCLVFVRNVHLDTNRTTLRALFARAFEDDDVGGPAPASVRARAGGEAQARPGGAGLDYVDFTKGMDACHLRLASPHYATRLIAFFNTRDTAQGDGLDAVGRTPVQGDKPIVVEMVQGKKEELYWEKVPEKVRRQAVERALQAGTEEPSTHTLAPRDHRQKKRTREP